MIGDDLRRDHDHHSSRTTPATAALSAGAGDEVSHGTLHLLEAALHLLLRNNQRRHEPHHLGPGRNHQHSCAHELGRDVGRSDSAVVGQLDAADQPPAAHLLDDLRKFRGELVRKLPTRA